MNNKTISLALCIAALMGCSSVYASDVLFKDSKAAVKGSADYSAVSGSLNIFSDAEEDLCVGVPEGLEGNPLKEYNRITKKKKPVVKRSPAAKQNSAALAKAQPKVKSTTFTATPITAAPVKSVVAKSKPQQTKPITFTAVPVRPVKTTPPPKETTSVDFNDSDDGFNYTSIYDVDEVTEDEETSYVSMPDFEDDDEPLVVQYESASRPAPKAQSQEVVPQEVVPMVPLESAQKAMPEKTEFAFEDNSEGLLQGGFGGGVETAVDEYSLRSSDSRSGFAPEMTLREQSEYQFLDYVNGMMNTIYTKVGYTTVVIMPAGEKLERVTIGDRQRFNVSTVLDKSSGCWHIYLQPIQMDVETNIVIATNRHLFNATLATSEMFRPFVKWINVPGAVESVNIEDGSLDLGVKDVNSLNFGYKRSGKGNYPWAPLNVFDDKGAHTFISFDGKALDRYHPVILTRGANDEMKLVPYSRYKNTYIIDSVYDILEVRVGEKSAIYHR